jgi:predicted dehydrogenase
MVRVGVIGLGMMGLTHLDVYGKRKDAKVVALSDADPDRLSGKIRAAGNIDGQAQGGFDFATVRKYPDGKALIADRDVDLVDICLPTPLHREFVLAALAAGKHVLVEKPLARTAAEAEEISAAARKAKGMCMCALCIRFWPGWSWLKDAIADGRYGKVLSASFRRVSAHPGGPYYSNGKASGGALLDLHIHDADFVQHCFGMPKAVWSRGYTKISGAVDHVLTTYVYDGVPLVAAEGGWAMAGGFPFTMQYAVNFERATAAYDLASPQPLKVWAGGKEEAVGLEPGMGYEIEIDYFLDCIGKGKRPDRATPDSAAASIRIVEAEAESVRTGKPVEIR